jgi:hypothetical protein
VDRVVDGGKREQCGLVLYRTDDDRYGMSLERLSLSASPVVTV